MKKLLITAVFASLSLFATEKEVNMKVNGMTCQMCAKSVKETLMTTEGVKDAKIYLKEGKAVVKTEKDIDMNALNEKLKKHGYSAELSK
jgi:copper chaperone CopZ